MAPRSKKLEPFAVRLIRNSDPAEYSGTDLAKRFGVAQQTVAEIRRQGQLPIADRDSHQDVDDVQPRDTYAVADAIDFLNTFPDGYLEGIATSPPYNKAFNGRGKNGAKSNWPKSKLMADGYELHNDNLPEHEYVAQQQKFLHTALRKVGDDGVILYNIGRKIKNLREDRREAIVADFPVRQVIIWNRGSSNNQGGKRPTIFPPIHELIYIIAGDKWRLPQRWLCDFRKWGDVWHIPFENHNPHPAPFPIDLAVRMVMTVGGPIADPFAGSGTLGVAAEYVNDTEGTEIPYYLNDHCEKYRDLWLANRDTRLTAYKEMKCKRH